MCPGDYKGLGLVDHMSSGDRRACVCVCCVYRRENSSLSIHVNASENARGGRRKSGQLKKKNGEKPNSMTDASDNSQLESSGVFKSSMPV